MKIARTNIWSPPNAAKLLVMLWIHGGGNTIGHGGSYNGAALATQRSVVIVTINYRLESWLVQPPGSVTRRQGRLQLRHPRRSPCAGVGARQYRGFWR